MNELERMILRDGLDDWVPLFAMDGFAQVIAPDAGIVARRREIIDVVRRLHSEGLVEVGTVTKGKGFKPVDDPSALLRSAATHESDPEFSDWGFIFWTNNTEEGDRVANAL